MRDMFGLDGLRESPFGLLWKRVVDGLVVFGKGGLRLRGFLTLVRYSLMMALGRPSQHLS